MEKRNLYVSHCETTGETSVKRRLQNHTEIVPHSEKFHQRSHLQYQTVLLYRRGIFKI